MKLFKINSTLRIVLQKETEAEALEEADQLIATLEQIQSYGEDTYEEQGIDMVAFGEPEVPKGQ